MLLRLNGKIEVLSGAVVGVVEDHALARLTLGDMTLRNLTLALGNLAGDPGQEATGALSHLGAFLFLFGFFALRGPRNFQFLFLLFGLDFGFQFDSIFNRFIAFSFEIFVRQSYGNVVNIY